MSDNLRDRIAAVIHAADPRPVSDGPSVQDFHVADAVMDSFIDLLYGEWCKGYEAARRDMGQEGRDGIQPFA